jgi:hypothetical protein
MTAEQATTLWRGGYTFGEADQDALVRALLRPLWQFRLIMLAVWLAYVTFMVWMMKPQSPLWASLVDFAAFHDPQWPIYAIVGSFLLIFLLLPDLRRMLGRRIYRKSLIANSVNAFEIGDDGFTFSAPHRVATIKWPLIKRIIVTEERLFLLVSKREAFVLPRRAFADAAGYAAVVALAQRKVPRVQPK